MTSVKIIHALPEQIDDLCAIGAECGLSPWTRQGYENEMQRPDSIILVAVDFGGQVLGFIVGRANPDVANPADATAEIYNIGTRPFIRKVGVGSMLLNRFIELCRSRGAIQAWLEVRASNHEAKAFYTLRGFIKCTVRMNFYTSPVEDAEVMYLDLTRGHS